MGEIKNFIEVGDAIATSGQPSESQLKEVASAGDPAALKVIHPPL